MIFPTSPIILNHFLKDKSEKIFNKVLKANQDYSYTIKNKLSSHFKLLKIQKTLVKCLDGKSFPNLEILLESNIYNFMDQEQKPK